MFVRLVNVSGRDGIRLMPFGNSYRFDGQLSNELIDAFRETLKSLWREQAWMDLPKLYFRGFDEVF
jgi:hypothetical protein